MERIKKILSRVAVILFIGAVSCMPRQCNPPGQEPGDTTVEPGGTELNGDVAPLESPGPEATAPPAVPGVGDVAQPPPPEAGILEKAVTSRDGVYQVNLSFGQNSDPYAGRPVTLRLTFMLPERGETVDVDRIRVIPVHIASGKIVEKDLEVIQHPGKPNEFEIRDFVFPHPGAWDIRVEAEIKGKTDTATFPVVILAE